MKIKSWKRSAVTFVLVLVCLVAVSCRSRAGAAQKAMPADTRIIFLHHSTGECIWNGGVPAWFRAYNAANKTRYAITEQAFPKESPYGWENYPYDYWNIWVKNAGAKPFKGEPTLEMLTAKYNVIVFKHCFPVSNIEADGDRGSVGSSDKRIQNYRLQYAPLKKKMRQFPKVRFIVWTGAAQVKNDTDEASAKRAKAFFNWVRNTWDEKGDNIYLWDFYQLETDGSLYMKAAHASGDAHPNEKFSKRVAPYFCQRIVDVIQGRGDTAGIIAQHGKPARPAAVVPVKPAPPDKPVAKVPPATAPATPPAKIATSGPGRWIFDDAEKKALAAQRWPKAAAYARDGSDNVIKINFAAGNEEDWGQYGKQRVVFSARPAKNYDLTPYRYLAFRVKSDQAAEVVLSLVTLPDPAGAAHQPHFAFTGYIRPKPGAWKQVVLDLAKLELAVEGAGAHEKAGKPTRPMHLTCLKFCTNKKNEKAVFLIDDIVFLRDLPKALRGHLQSP